jgi:hypothetical protein
LATWFPCGKEIIVFILGSLSQRSRSPLIWIEFLTTGSFPHDNFSSEYWIFTKLDHMIALWKGKNPFHLEIIRSKVKVTVTVTLTFDLMISRWKGFFYKYNFWQQGRFCMITLVLYIGSLPNLSTWFPSGGGRTLFILGLLGQRSRSLLQ